MNNPSAIQQGWWHHARMCQSPNYDDRPAHAQIDLLVLHSISLPPAQYGGAYIEQLFTNQLDCAAHPYFERLRNMRVSAHFVIDRHGNTTQYVSCNHRAWHAGQSSWRGRNRCNDDSIGIELEGLEGLHFTPAQYHTLKQLTHALLHAYPIDYIAGHEHIAPTRKADPGAGFDWKYFQKITQLPCTYFPEGVLISSS